MRQVGVRALLLTLALLAPPRPVASTQLWADYRRDHVAADAKYRDKALLVSGAVRAVSATYTLYLEGGPGQVDGVTAVLRDSEIAKAGPVRVGQQLRLECVGAGVVFNEPVLLACKF